jgi:hypothetical protein
MHRVDHPRPHDPPVWSQHGVQEIDPDALVFLRPKKPEKDDVYAGVDAKGFVKMKGHAWGA